MIDRELLGTPIRIGSGSLAGVGAMVVSRAKARSYAIITDDTVAALPICSRIEESLRSAAPDGRVLRRQLPPGETQKTREQWTAISDWLLAEACGRDTTIVALGGGVIGDLAGFVAATYMRGIPVVQLPTTLVAMVDAAVGGKTGVDTSAGKNLIGAFHRPALVVIDPSVLQTLPDEHVRAGLAEVLKHGAIADADYFHSASRHAASLMGSTAVMRRSWWTSREAEQLVLRSVEIKSAVVAADERESGQRESLNFGHTVAHAIELVSDYAILHGHAVAIGMIVEATAGEDIGVSEGGLANSLRAALGSAGLPTHASGPLDENRLIEAMHGDKKSRGRDIRCAIPSRLGVMSPTGGRWSVTVPQDRLRSALRAAALPAPATANR